MQVESPNPIQLFKEYFDKRGIHADTRDDNRIQLVSYEFMRHVRPLNSFWRTAEGFCAYIPYHDLEGNPIEYYGARLLDLGQRASFNDQLGLTASKFIVPPGLTHAYFPLNNPPMSRDVRCVVTESAIKAIVAASCGYFAVGLNGCWGFRSRHTTDRLMPDLRSIPWSSFKDVVFLTDSDWATNPRVNAAAAEFYSEMQSLYRVEVRHLRMPHDPDGEKWGLDDYYAEHGRTATEELLGSEGSVPDHNDFMRAMHELNERAIYIKGADLFADIANNLLVKEKHFHNLFAPLRYTDSDDNEKQATRAWIAWEHRREVQDVVNRPGHPITDEATYYNLWRPAEIDPYKGDVSVHERFMRAAVSSEDERRWLQQWIAHVVQRQDVKMNTSLVFYSTEQGTGKTMLAESIAMMLGRKNTARTSMDVVRSSFNEAYAGKQLVVINETLASDRAGASGFMDKLKTLITEESIMYHAKGKGAFEMENHANYILTTNHVDALRIDPSDRRFAILEFGSQFRGSAEAEQWGEECWQWHRDHLAELLWYYMEEVSIDGFKHSAPALETQAKRDMAEAGYSDMELLVKDLLGENTRGDTLSAVGLKRTVQWVEGRALVVAAFAGQVNNSNLRSMTTRLGNAFKKFGVASEQFKVATPAGVVVVRMYPVATTPDRKAGPSDYLAGSSSKVAT